ncbi:MAG: ABC transporter permease, partial [Rhodoglobus sp.]
MTWIINNLDLIWGLTLEHIRLSIPPIVLGFLISIPLGWVAYRFKLTRGILLTLAGLLYTIPSLAMFVLLPPLIGIPFLSELNITIALTLYAVAIMARSVADALGSVDPAIRQSATAVGFGGWRR